MLLSEDGCVSQEIEGSVSKVEMATPMALIYIVLLPSVSTFETPPSKDLTWCEKQRWLSLAYYHFVLPHKSLRARLPTPELTRGAGSPRMWRPVTPAMAAGLTDHVWTTDELLAYRVPVEFLDQLRTIEHLFPEWNGVHHSN